MKKLFLSILVICSLLGGNAFANTNNKEIINKKLYEEYSTCTVYFKFLSIAKEKQGKYKKKKSEKDFLERMQELTTTSVAKDSPSVVLLDKLLAKPTPLTESTKK